MLTYSLVSIRSPEEESKETGKVSQQGEIGSIKRCLYCTLCVCDDVCVFYLPLWYKSRSPSLSDSDDDADRKRKVSLKVLTLYFTAVSVLLFLETTEREDKKEKETSSVQL